MRAFVLTCLLLTALAAGAGTLAAAQPPQPLVGECNAVTSPCWNGDTACVWFSLQVPQCVPPLVLTTGPGPMQPPTDASSQPLVGACNAVTSPCWNGDPLCVGLSLEVPQCLPPILG